MSNETKWVRGPWVVVNESVSGHCCFEFSVTKENGDHVCESWSDKETVNLIAAAPELYEALEYAIKYEPALANARCIKKSMAKARGES